MSATPGLTVYPKGVLLETLRRRIIALQEEGYNDDFLRAIRHVHRLFDELLALAHQYADECGDCAGTRVYLAESRRRGRTDFAWALLRWAANARRRAATARLLRDVADYLEAQTDALSECHWSPRTKRITPRAVESECIRNWRWVTRLRRAAMRMATEERTCS